MCCLRLAENAESKKLPKIRHTHHRTTLSGYIFASKACIDNRKKTLLNSNISTRSHKMVNFGPLTAEIGSGVWDTPAHFNQFRVLGSLLHRRRATEVYQTLHDVWPSPGLVHYIDFGGSCPVTEFCQVQNSLCVQLLRSPYWQRYCTALEQLVGVSQTLRRSAEGATYILQGGHHVGHRPTF